MACLGGFSILCTFYHLCHNRRYDTRDEIVDYIPKYFKPYELLPKKVYWKLEHAGWSEVRMWSLFDPRTLHAGDKIRERYGKMVANTWYWGGVHQYRGFRDQWCRIGALWSQHRYGRAEDLVPMEVTVEEIWEDIEAGNNFLYITCIEKSSSKKKVTWLHHDERNFKGLLIVYP